MERVKRIFEDRRFTWFLLGIGTLVILGYYFCKIPDIYSVWELVDEFGYLANAAYLSGNTWPHVTDFYYGYGYSLWLVPLFWTCESGIQIIRGAIAINALCVVALFWVQYALMTKVCKHLHRNIILICSFVLCFYPYLVASGLKVLCETMLTFMIWLSGLMLYQALHTEKWYYYVLLGICVVYSFFIHARAFVFCGVVIFTIAVLFLLKRVKFRQVILTGLTMLVLLFLGFSVKNQVIENVYVEEIKENTAVSFEKYDGAVRTTSALENTEDENDTERIEETEDAAPKVNNIVTISYIFEKMKALITNFSKWHIFGFACRNFYLFVGTAGMFHIGLFVALKDVFTEWKEEKKISSDNAVKFMFAVAAIMAVLAVIVQSPYSLEKPAYNFYGRYYEYIIGPVVFLGIDFCVRKKISILGKTVWLFLFGISYFGTMEMANYLEIQELKFDSCRLAALSFFAKECYYRAVVRYAASILLIVIAIILVLNYFEKIRKIIPIVLLALFMINNHAIETEILWLQKENKEECDMVEFIQDTYNVDKIYFLNSGFSYPVAYAGLQPLLGRDKLIVLEGYEKENLMSGDLFISFHNNPYLEQTNREIAQLYNTTYYELYVVE